MKSLVSASLFATVAFPASLSAQALAPLSADELVALRPLAQHGVALLVRDADRGPLARVTVLVRSRAPLATVHDLVADPTQYPTFMTGAQHVQLRSQHANHLAFSFDVRVAIFEVSTTAALHLVSPVRIDGQIVESSMGPGTLRWDFYPDGDGTLIAYTTSGDPTAGSWFLRTVARASPAAIAGMQLSYDSLLALSVARRAEIVAGAHVPPRPAVRAITGGDPAPPAGAWSQPADHAVVGAVVLDDATGALRTVTVAIHTDETPETVRARLADVSAYNHVFPFVQSVNAGAASGETQPFHSVIDTALFHAEGDQSRILAGDTVWWRGTGGDFVHDVLRWDVTRDPRGGSLVALSGGDEYARAGAMARTMIDRDPWMMTGYAAALELVYVRTLVNR